MEKNLSFNQVNFHFFSTESFSDEKYLNAWSLKGSRLNAKEWFAFKHENKGKFYNEHLKNTLESMQNIKNYFSIDMLEGINIHSSDEWIDFLPKNYPLVYDRLCQDKSKYTLYRYNQENILNQIGIIKNLSPNFPFWNAQGENFSQSEIDTFIHDDNLAPHFNKYDIYFHSSLSLTFNFNEENIESLLNSYNDRIQYTFIPKSQAELQERLNLKKEEKIILELENIFLNLCKGISADYAFMDFSYFFMGYDYVLNSKNSFLKSYPISLDTLIHKRSFKEHIEEYANNYFLNYYSKKLMDILDTYELFQDRLNRYIINYDKTPKNINEENILGMLSKQNYTDINIEFLNFINYQDYVYINKDDFWDLSIKDNDILWEKFLNKNTLKPFPINFDCSLEEKLLYATDEEFFSVLKAHRMLNG